MLGVPGRNVAAFSGGMLVVAELLLIIAVAIAGKDGWKLITGYLLRAFSRFAPAEKVGRQRYRIGLAMFVVPLLTAWATPYVSGLLPLTQAQVLSIAVAGDVLLLASLFVLGGEFWDKLRSLFDYDMSAIKTEIVGVPADPPP
jgi:hypothetical protein